MLRFLMQLIVAGIIALFSPIILVYLISNIYAIAVTLGIGLCVCAVYIIAGVAFDLSAKNRKTNL